MQADFEMPHGVWGCLVPLVPSPHVSRVDFTKEVYSIGRDIHNQIVFGGAGVSNLHATIKWNKLTTTMSVVTITDHSSNGTWVDNVKVKADTGTVHQVFDGSVICFGSLVPVVGEAADYRYTFHHAYGRRKNESVNKYYTLCENLGGGEFGTVHRAFEKATSKVFAVKTAMKYHQGQGIGVMCASQETMAMMRLRHPNICQIHEVFFCLEGNSVDLVLEYVHGITLYHLLWWNPDLDERFGRELSFQICSAVAYMHLQGVSHGDLKPDNILVTSEDRPLIKVADFGLARVLSNINIEPFATVHAFTAPEAQAQVEALGDQLTIPMCQAWDCWAVGGLIFNILAGSHPFPEGRAFDFIDDLIPWSLTRIENKSDQSRNLLKRLLVKFQRRICMKDALNHPWFAGYTPGRVPFEGEVTFVEPPSISDRGEDEEDDEMMVDTFRGIDTGRRTRGKRLRRSAHSPRHLIRSKPGPGQLQGRPGEKRPAKRR